MKTGIRLLIAGSLLVWISAAQAAEWTAEKKATVEGFNVPESVCPLAGEKVAFVSNIQDVKEGMYWADDGAGFISRFELGTWKPLGIWAKPASGAELHAPKGMAIAGGWLWVADNSRVRRYMLKGDQRAETVPIEGAERLNDMAAFGDEVFVSDTAKGRIHAIRVDAPREQRLIPSPSGINGLAFSKDAMWGVSWSEHDIYLLDRAGKKPPKALGLAAHFTNLDGIEVLPDGQLVVSDFVGNKVCVVNTATKAVKTLIETQTPADIGWDEAGKMLYVPIFEHDRVEIYQLTER